MNKNTERASISGNQKDPGPSQEEPCEKLLQSGDVAKVLGGAQIVVSQIAGFVCCWFI